MEVPPNYDSFLMEYNPYLNKEKCNKLFFNNFFLQNMAIVSIVNINDQHTESVKKIFECSLYFSRFNTTRKAFKGKYLLIKIKSVINKVQ